MSANPVKPKTPKKIKAKFKAGYTPGKPENVFLVEDSPVLVEPGDTVDIFFECTNGFSVLIPYAFFFNGNYFPATKQPSWAPKPSSPKKVVWGVRLIRSQMENPHPDKEMAYCIYSNDLDNFAVASSPPKMDLKP